MFNFLFLLFRSLTRVFRSLILCCVIASAEKLLPGRAERLLGVPEGNLFGALVQ
jgi:hypothetical protein